MRTDTSTGEDAPTAGGNLPQGERPQQCSEGNGKALEKALTPSRTAGNDFLRIPIQSIYLPDDYIMSLIDFDGIAEYVRDTFTNYAKLIGRNFSYELKGDLGKDLATMLPYFQSLLDVCDQVEAEYSIGPNKEFQVHLVSDKHFCDTIYVLPLKSLRFMDDCERRLYEYFVSYYAEVTGSSFPFQNDMLECFVEDYDLDEYFDDYDEDDKESWYGSQASYAKGGWVHETSGRIYRLQVKSMDSVLISFSYMYGDTGLRHSELFAYIQEGVRILSEGPMIANMGYFETDGVYDELPDCNGAYPVSMDRLMLIGYEENDSVMREYEGWINEEAGNYGCVAGYQGLEITPYTIQPLAIDNTLPKFDDWFKRFTNFLDSCYERDNTEDDTEDDA